jgi:hypothetical protein
MNDIEHTFEYAKDSLKLSDAEKASGRAQLLSVLKAQPMRTPVRSPFTTFFFSPALRYAVVLLAMIVAGSGGIAYASTSAEPADALYAVKVKVTEPLQLAFTFDDGKRATREVALVNERLKEVAQASVDTTLTASQIALVTDSLSAQIDNAQDDITSLHENNQSGEALATVSDLAATLSAHAGILDKLQDTNPEVSASIAPVVAEISGELSETSTLVTTTQDAITTDDVATTTLSDPTDQQADDIASSLEDVKRDVADTLATFDASDKQDIATSIFEIQALVTEAQTKDGAGDTKGAYLLYSEADQKLTSLILTIEADQSLNIDVIDATTTDAQ